MIGSSIAHYKVTAKLGAGGMGEVYRATDSKLGRDVALKILPAEMANDPQRLARFQREARTIAALNHPHIVTIFSVEESGGRHFLTMELVEGQPLNRCIPEAGLPLQQLVEIVVPLADALAAAHEKNIVHRDLKPANVMLTGDGRVKVLDFGLAKETRTPSDSDATLSSAGNTEAGIVMGTPAYMSPEQVTGRAVDHRTDIFSLGVLLYEMATGKRPFAGASSVELASSILRDAASPVTELRTDLPADLARIIRRCLEKDPRHRMQTARDVCNEFRDLARTVAPGAASAAAVASRSAPRAGSGEFEARPAERSAATVAAELWVAVLPFKSPGGEAELGAFAEGLTDDITTGLSRFSYLHVISRSAASLQMEKTSDSGSGGKPLGARYVLEGSVRKAGRSLRVSARVTDTATGEHVWAENYDRDAKDENLFAIQDEITAKIVSTVGDSYGALPRAMAAVVKRKPLEQATPYEAVLLWFSYNQLISAEEHAVVRSCLERAVKQAPDYADAWAALALLYADEYKQNFNLRADPLGRAAAATARALALDPANPLAYFSLATTRFFQKDFEAFRPACERAIALNPLDGSTKAFLGILTAYSGDWERGLALTEEALALNPHHPGWYRFAQFFGHYRKQEYQEALSVARRINMPTYFYYHAILASVLGQLGRREEAQQPIRELLKAFPDYPAQARAELSKWLDPELVDHYLDGLRKAGLADLPAPSTGLRKEESQVSSKVTRTHLGEKSILVLPFINRSPDPGNEHFSDGLTEEIISDLSRVEALRVISRNSAMALKGKTQDTPTIAKELGVTHVVSGSVRRAGDSLRVTAELIEAATDTPVWSEKYSGSVADVFGIQEEIAQRIVEALKVKLTDSGAQQVTQRPIENVVAYECYLRVRQEIYGWTPESQERAIRLVDQALGIVGENPLLLATKGQICWNKVNGLIDPDERHLEEATDCVRRALALDPQNYMAIFVRGLVAGLRGQTADALRDCHRSYQLLPGDPNALAELTRFANAAGVDVEGYIEELVQMDPLTPVTWLTYAYHHLMAGRFEKALTGGRRALELAPAPSNLHFLVASAIAAAGMREEAIAVLERTAASLTAPVPRACTLLLKYALEGQAEKACAQMTPLVERTAGWVDHLGRYIADCYSLIGRNHEALMWLRKAMDHGFINYPFLAVYDPLLANVRSDPRFAPLMQEVRARWEALGQNLPQPLRLIALPKDSA